ncbi:MAG: iron-sulfur cluster assembly accessory protein [Gammaproteobacteria bacterium]|nr:iron-sulfur cluster assembly accessory protein [Gammaproteobacteria bacterium]
MDIISFSPAAIAQIKKNVQEAEHGNLALRIAAQMTADETVHYGIGFDETKEDDVTIDGDGFRVVVSPDCVELLNGAHVDFVEIEEGKHHFIFLNPNDPSYKPPTEIEITE